jgi:hypothetical protein
MYFYGDSGKLRAYDWKKFGRMEAIWALSERTSERWLG